MVFKKLNIVDVVDCGTTSLFFLFALDVVQEVDDLL
jgi:hypothetical protein